MSLAQRWLTFAEDEAKGRSDLYEEIARGVAGDEELLRLLSTLSHLRQQPNLLLASVRYLGGPSSSFAEFRTFALDRWQDVLYLLTTRRTQTNEVGRCAILLPALAQLPGPLALLEVGASAGLCLLLDRYSYQYGDRVVGVRRSPVRLRCQADGPAPIPEALPDVIWRRGIDLNPLAVVDNDDMRWLESCVWPDQAHRIERLRAAISVAREDPPDVLKGDLLERTVDVAALAPTEATLVIFHAAVLTYLTPPERQRFTEIVTGIGAAWISNEGRGVVDVNPGLLRPSFENDGLAFVLATGRRPLALADPHGARLRWL